MEFRLKPRDLKYLLLVVLIFEVALNLIIIIKVPYTEIDWIAYMQEVGYFISGERNYKLMRGDTGPLVYPAGFLYVFSLLKYVTNQGENLRIGYTLSNEIDLLTFV